MSKDVQRRKAERLLELHQGPQVFVVGSVWDVPSARIFEQAGFTALATSSAGVAYTVGYPDGEKLPAVKMIAAVGRIAAAVDIPVSADMEAGYGREPEAAVASCRAVLDAGAVGVNLEDAADDVPGTLVPAEAHAAKIAAVRKMANAYGVPLVINARTDVFLHKVGEESGRLREAVARLQRYRDAGADCLFAPGVVDAETIRALVKDVGAPLNILATPGCPSVAELATLGVRRMSQGSG
ncbi:MAG: isocitrate lyase/phosphoenolpyruvate mutase family protein, partial [Burkholderiales bacterium]